MENCFIYNSLSNTLNKICEQQNLNEKEEILNNAGYNDKIINNSFYNYQKDIELCYQQIFNSNIKQLFIDSIQAEKDNNSLNHIFWDIYDIFENIQIDKIEQVYKEKLIY